MSTRLLLNLLLAAVALALALFILLGPTLAPEDDARGISALDSAAVTTIALTRRDGDPLDFARRDNRWTVTAGRTFPADEFQVNTLLALLQATTTRAYPAATLELGPMGLSPPLASIRFDAERFDIGNVESIDKRRYVLAGDIVYLLADRYQHLLNARYTNFIERRLLPEGSTVTGLGLADRMLELDADNQWQLQPEDPAIGSDVIRGLVSAWQQARALYVREHDDIGGEIISVQLAGRDKPVAFNLRRDGSDYVLARPDLGIQYHLTEAAGSRLLEFAAEPGADL